MDGFGPGPLPRPGGSGGGGDLKRLGFRGMGAGGYTRAIEDLTVSV